MPRIIDVKANDYKSEEVLSQGRIQKRLKITYLIDASDVGVADVTEDVILATDGLPLIGQSLRGAYCVSRSADEVETHPCHWEVECKFDTRIDIDTIEQSDLPPEDRTPDWDWDAEMIDQVLEVDPVTGLPVTNTVGEPIIIAGPVAIPILNITRYEIYFDPDVILHFVNKVNATTFWGAPPGCALLAAVRDRKASLTLPDGTPVSRRQVSYQIKFNFARNQEGQLIGWKAQPLNHGTKCYKLTFPDPQNQPSVFVRDLIPIQDSRGNPATGNLSLTGTLLSPDDEPIYLTYNRFLPAELNTLMLGPF